MTQKKITELIFATRADFRQWLQENAETSAGVWLVFGKSKQVATLTAHEALEEALCLGWIDGQMKSIDDTKYRKYFAKRRPKSPWSEKNKKIIETLRERELMTELGEKAVEAAQANGMWDASPSGTITDEQIADFAEKLSSYNPAHDNFMNMPRSAKAAYIRRYLSFKKEESRQRDFEKIIELLTKNMKPTISRKEGD
jgi:uncharacterized protein YdeI (YjbR/CyaY-like superfamily)